MAGTESCPFGTSCHYAHLDPEGKEVPCDPATPAPLPRITITNILHKTQSPPHDPAAQVQVKLRHINNGSDETTILRANTLADFINHRLT